SVPPSVEEGDGLLPGAGQVRLPAALSTNLIVTLASLNQNEVIVPGQVTILAGHTNAAFDLTILDDTVLDGTQIATITASASGFLLGSANLLIFDHQPASLHLALPATATEGQGTIQGTVQISAVPASNIVVTLY